MQDGKKLAYYFQRYSLSLQTTVYERTGNYFYGKGRRPVDFVYLCPLCLKNTISFDGEDLRYKEEFTLDHFPPESVGGKGTVLVCKKCNSTAGEEFEYSLKEWVRDQSAVKWIPETKIPVKLELQNTNGKYRGHLVVKGPYSFDWKFDNYPLVDQWFDRVQKGKNLIQSISLPKPDLSKVYKSLLKAAYLYSFFTWGYDFVFTETGDKIRKCLFENEPHILSNSGIFFHMEDQCPPDGLCYVFKPVELQTFMINIKLFSKEVNFQCGISVLISGSDAGQWNQLKAYQSIIDNDEKFTQAIIKLPEDILTNDNLFPYTKTWKQRLTFKIFGKNI